MFAWKSYFKFLTAGKSLDAPVSGGVVSRGPIIANYKLDLIDGLKEDHVDLLETLGEISSYLSKRKFKKVHSYLNHLRSEFFHHLMTEDGILYYHLRFHYTDNKELLDTINEFKTSMSGIQKEIKSFIIKWTKEKDIPKNENEFSADLNAIREAFSKRVGHEETHLYSLYENIPTVVINNVSEIKELEYVST